MEVITSENDSQSPEDGSDKSEVRAVAAEHKMGPVPGSPPRQDHLTDQAITHSTQGLKLQRQHKKKYRRYTSPYGRYDHSGDPYVRPEVYRRIVAWAAQYELVPDLDPFAQSALHECSLWQAVEARPWNHPKYHFLQLLWLPFL